MKALRFYTYLVFGLIIASFHPNIGHSAENRLPLQGAGFSDPNATVKKPLAWSQKAITYPKWAKSADLAMVLDQQVYHSLLTDVQSYAKEQNIKVAVSEGRCGNTKKLLNKRGVDIGGWCCPPGNFDRLPGLKFHTIGIGALAIIVHKDNPIDNLTLQQVRDIFQGKITNWNQIVDGSALKGGNLPIRPSVRLHCKPRPGHWRLILDNENLFGFNVEETGTIPNMILKSVSNYPGSIGFETLGHLDRYKNESFLKVLKIDGVDPNDSKALAQGRYPFYRTHSLTTWQQESAANPHADKMVSYVIKLIESKGLMNNPYKIVPASYLREAKWQFKGEELVGIPK
ncbi:MAG: substrate-binding domain-containing protein [Magnetococcales bacterium]|nr:substrate-binding domain-containing protein [Magnetococcales bacterium]